MNGVAWIRAGGPTPLGNIRRLGYIALMLLAYRLAFLPIYRHVGSAAFSLAMLTCLMAGALLGVPGGLAIVAVSVALDRSLAFAVGLEATTGRPALVLSVLAKLTLAVGAGLIAQSARRLREANARLSEESSRRERSESELAANEQRYRVLVECLGEGVGLFDESDLCQFANPAWFKTFGKRPEEILGTSFAAHLDEPSRQRVLEHRSRSDPGRHGYEVVPLGLECSVLLVTETQLVAGTRAGYSNTLRVVRDLTDRVESDRKQRELERQLQRGQALQSLAVLAGGVAHDFNNLLSGIVGNAEYALRRVPRAAPLELTQSLEEIREFASEASQLSRQMLAYAGRRSLAVTVVDVNAEVREALRLLHSTIESQALLRLELMGDLASVKADRLQLRQVVTNLVLNALDAMAPARGTLTIRTCTEMLEADDLLRLQVPEGTTPGIYVAIAVEDTGVGIPEDLKERIFDPFFSTKSPGRGMGLAASAGIVRSHRGWLDVTSELGRGTCFRVLLPLVNAAQTPIRRLTPLNLRPPRSGNILLIDDEAAVRVVTNRLLSDLGQRVMTADSGQKGLELFRQHHASIDLVLLDLTMPELSGAEVLHELRRIRQDVPVVVTSGYHPSNAGELLHESNVVGFLEKPHTVANLEAIVASIFAS